MKLTSRITRIRRRAYVRFHRTRRLVRFVLFLLRRIILPALMHNVRGILLLTRMVAKNLLLGWFLRWTYDVRMIGRYDHKESDLHISTARVLGSILPYETAVIHPLYNGDHWIIVEAYDNRAAALQGHNKWVKTMTHAPYPETLSDCANSKTTQLLIREGVSFKFKRREQNVRTD